MWFKGQRYWFCCMLACMLFCSAASLYASPETVSPQQVLTVGVVPQFDMRHIHAVWRPILDELEQRTGMKFVLKGAATIPGFERDLSTGEFDLAYINPYQMIKEGLRQGYRALVRDRLDLYGIVVVAENSPIHSVRELKGQAVAFPAPNALGATLMVRAELLDQYGVEIIPRYVSSHTSVYLNVALAENLAGGGVQKTLEQQKGELQHALRVLYKTRSVPSHPLVIHPRVPQDVQTKIQASLLGMWQDLKTQELLTRVPYNELHPARAEDYAPLAGMGLERFE